MIQYPSLLTTENTIGIVATSSGVTGPFIDKLDQSKSYFSDKGFRCIEMYPLRQQMGISSGTAKERAEGFMKLYLDDSVDWIIPPWGGEILIDILPLLDYEQLKSARSKWVQGFSDTSTLLFVLTTKLGIATVHGPNLLDFGTRPVHHTVENSIHVLSNEETIQKSTDQYQIEWADVSKNPYAPYQLTEKTLWQSLSGEDIFFSGRLIGGCLDVLSKLIGTPYAPVNDFIRENHEHGFIWFLENCEMNGADIYRTLLQMKYCGWFEHCHGILYGRPEGYQDVAGFTYVDALKKVTEDLNIPVIYDVDIGHMPPQLTLINGAYAEVSLINHQGSIKQSLR